MKKTRLISKVVISTLLALFLAFMSLPGTAANAEQAPTAVPAKRLAVQSFTIEKLTTGDYSLTMEGSLDEGDAWTVLYLPEVVANQMGAMYWEEMTEILSRAPIVGNNWVDEYLVPGYFDTSSNTNVFTLPSDTKMVFVAKTFAIEEADVSFGIKTLGGAKTMPTAGNAVSNQLEVIPKLAPQDFEIEKLDSGMYQVTLSGNLDEGDAWTVLYLPEQAAAYYGETYWGEMVDILEDAPLAGRCYVDEYLQEGFYSTSSQTSVFTVPADTVMIFVAKTCPFSFEEFDVNFAIKTLGGACEMPQEGYTVGNQLIADIMIDNIEISVDASKIPILTIGGKVPNYGEKPKALSPFVLPSYLMYNSDCSEGYGDMCSYGFGYYEYAPDGVYMDSNGNRLNSDACMEDMTVDSDTLYAYYIELALKEGYYLDDNVTVNNGTSNFVIEEMYQREGGTYIRIRFDMGTLEDIEELVEELGGREGVCEPQAFEVSCKLDGSYLVTLPGGDDLKPGLKYGVYVITDEVVNQLLSMIPKEMLPMLQDNPVEFVWEAYKEAFSELIGNPVGYDNEGGFRNFNSTERIEFFEGNSVTVPASSRIIIVAQSDPEFSDYPEGMAEGYGDLFEEEKKYIFPAYTIAGCVAPEEGAVSVEGFEEPEADPDGGEKEVITDPVVVTETGSLDGANTSRNLAVDVNGNIYTTYTNPEDGYIYVSKSTDGGTTFSAGVKVSDNQGYESEINCSSNGMVYVTYSTESSNMTPEPNYEDYETEEEFFEAMDEWYMANAPEIHIAYSSNQAKSFTDVTVGNSPFSEAGCTSAHMATDGNHVYIVPAAGQVFYYSSDEGKTFNATETGEKFAFSDILVDRNTHKVILIKDMPDIEYYVSDDYGASFTHVDLTEYCEVYYSTAAYGSPYIYIAGVDGFMYRINPSIILDEETNPFDEESGNVQLIEIPACATEMGRSISADDKGNVVTGYVADGYVYFVVSSDFGETWGKPIKVAEANAANAALNPINGDVLYLYGTDGGITLVAKHGFVSGYNVSTNPALISFDWNNLSATTETFDIVNNGSEAITVNSITATEGFSVDFTSAKTVAANSNLSVKVKYLNRDITSGTITITYNTTETLTVSVQVYKDESEEPHEEHKPYYPIIPPVVEVPEEVQPEVQPEVKEPTEPQGQKEDAEAAPETYEYKVPVKSEEAVQIDSVITENIAAVSEITVDDIMSAVTGVKSDAEKEETAEETAESGETAEGTGEGTTETGETAEGTTGSGETAEGTTGSGEAAETATEEAQPVEKITIDFSEAEQQIDGITLTKTTLDAISDVIADESNNITALEIKLSDVSLELDSKAIESIRKQADGDVIRMVVEITETATLNDKQTGAIEDMNVAKTFEAFIECNGKRVHDFKGGNAIVSIDFVPEKGMNPKNYHICYIAEDGSTEYYSSRFTGSSLEAVLNHFSDYAIVYDESVDNLTDEEVLIKYELDNLEVIVNSKFNVTEKDDSLVIDWGKVEGADGYIVRASYCGKKCKRVAKIKDADVTSFTLTELNGKALKLDKTFKIYVAAYKIIGGKKVVIARTICAHVAGSKNAATNVRVITPKEDSITLKVDERASVDVSIEKENTEDGKSLLSRSHCARYRYISSNTDIVKVNSTGRISAVASGTCEVYVIAQNGRAATITVTVK